MSKHYDLKGKFIKEDEYNAIVADLLEKWQDIDELERHDSHLDIRQFNDLCLKITLRWQGLMGEDITGFRFQSDYPIFEITIANFINGEWREEPMRKTYSKSSEAMLAFEDALLSYTKSYYDEDGSFVIVGNLMKSHNAFSEEYKRNKAEAVKPKSDATMITGVEW